MQASVSRPAVRLCAIRAFRTSAKAETKKTIQQLAKEVPLKGKNVFVRADLNVPVKGGEVKDKTRIVLSAPTIRFLLDQGAKVSLKSTNHHSTLWERGYSDISATIVDASAQMVGNLRALPPTMTDQVIVSSHMGRPKGQVLEEKRLTPVGPILESAIKAPVKLAKDCVGPEAEKVVQAAKEGEVVLLENLRFHIQETKNDPGFSEKLASYADIYVNDAFGAAHRAHASTHGVTKFVKHKVAGMLLDKELTSLGKITRNPEHPVVAVIGGSKVSTKLPVLESMLEKCDSILIGGGMMFTFSKALGYNIGKSLVENDLVDTAREFLKKAEAKGVNVVLPRDFVVAPDLNAESANKAIHADVKTYEGDGYGVDIGPLTVGDFHNVIKDAKTLLWNGPMGILEIPRYAIGTDSITRMAAFLSAKGGMAVVGGGDSLISVQKLELFDKITHVSTGGGAMLEFIEGKVLPGVEVLDEAK